MIYLISFAAANSNWSWSNQYISIHFYNYEACLEYFRIGNILSFLRDIGTFWIYNKVFLQISEKDGYKKSNQDIRTRSSSALFSVVF